MIEKAYIMFLLILSIKLWVGEFKENKFSINIFAATVEQSKNLGVSKKIKCPNV